MMTPPPANHTEKPIASSAEPLHLLIATILDRHHTYLKHELPAIEALISELAHLHQGGAERVAMALLPIFLRFRRELEAHMVREETTLFPLIQRLEIAAAAGRPLPQNSFGPLSNAIAFMNEDHDFERSLLEKMAEITGSYKSPQDAPADYATLMNRLRHLVDDMDEHVHIEDEVLFPKAVRLEESHSA
jgi:regulator of cell morphogenesis and NO signaling